jgi:hypothetical protein
MEEAEEYRNALEKEYNFIKIQKRTYSSLYHEREMKERAIVKITPTNIFIKNLMYISFDLFKEYLEKHDCVKELVSISLIKCFITHVDEDFFTMFPKLETIDLSFNILENTNFNISKSVVSINLSGMDKIKYNNKFAHLENVFINNPIVNNNAVNNIVDVVGVRIDDRDRDQDVNVHNGHIQDNIKNSIKYLHTTYDKYPYIQDYIQEIIMHYKKMKLKEDSFITRIIKTAINYYDITKLLNTYVRDKTLIVYDYENYATCKIENLLERVWALSKDMDECSSIIELLIIQLKEGLGVCFVGRYTRIVNTLSSFIPEITNDLPNNIKISNMITQLQKKGQNKQTILTRTIEFMNSLGLVDQKEWIDAINEIDE